MTVGAWQLTSGWEASAMNEQKPCLLQANATFYLGYDWSPEETAGRVPEQGKRTFPCAPVFLVVMAVVSLAFEICNWLIGPALLSQFGVILDLFSLSVARQSLLMLLGIGVAGCFSKWFPDSAERRHMFLTPLVAMGAGLILAWLGQLVGQSNAFDWQIVLVYLLWAWGSAVSAA
jgi:hypothetical protein